jgi:hypothetical protein
MSIMGRRPSGAVDTTSCVKELCVQNGSRFGTRCPFWVGPPAGGRLPFVLTKCPFWVFLRTKPERTQNETGPPCGRPRGPKQIAKINY